LGGAGGVTAMIDLSDGLATDLRHVADKSRAAARVDRGRLPIADATRDVAGALKHDAVGWASGGGEDYELLLTCEPSAFDRLRSGLGTATGTPLTAIGVMESGAAGVTFVDADGHAVDVGPGFEHFTSGARRERSLPAATAGPLDPGRAL